MNLSSALAIGRAVLVVLPIKNQASGIEPSCHRSIWPSIAEAFVTERVVVGPVRRCVSAGVKCDLSVAGCCVLLCSAAVIVAGYLRVGYVEETVFSLVIRTDFCKSFAV